MISRDELISFSKINNLRPHQQEKHYVQALILSSISEREVVFKGGTYLWFFHGLKRFSEDLDFTAIGKTEGIEDSISSDLEMLGVENKCRVFSDEERSFSFRISARGPLNTSEKDLCHVYVEISRREEVLEPTLPMKLDISAYGIPTKVVNAMALKEVAAEKVRAILTREKARDMYDLAFLLERGTPLDMQLVGKKLEYYGLEFSEREFKKKLLEKKKIWKQELGQLVFGELGDADLAVESIGREIRGRA
jgi:predicted nucleotidyltransferase component of viral defense system